MRSLLQSVLCLGIFGAGLNSAFAQTELLKVASPNRGSWEGAIPEMGKRSGIFQKHGLDVEIIYTAGGGQTMQAVISGSIDVGLSAGLAGTFGAFSRGAPVRIIGASSTGSRELYYYVIAAKSPITSLKEAHGKSIAYSTSGASSHVGALQIIKDYGLRNAKIIATGDATATLTQALTGQVDVGWGVGPFNLDRIAKGELRMIGQLSDLPHMRVQTTRVQIANLQTLQQRKPAIVKYLKAYREVLDWMYSSDDAIKIYRQIVDFPEASVRQTIKEFIPKESLQIDEVSGVPEAMQDAVQHKFISAPLINSQIEELIQIRNLK